MLYSSRRGIKCGLGGGEVPDTINELLCASFTRVQFDSICRVINSDLRVLSKNFTCEYVAKLHSRYQIKRRCRIFSIPASYLRRSLVRISFRRPAIFEILVFFRNARRRKPGQRLKFDHHKFVPY
jgi:hypothetical protein